MPLYFAYGSNMDEAAMRARCPNARVVDAARLPRHRFVLMGNGYASGQRDPASDLHGVLFDLALSDVPALDRYEEVARGLYTKKLQSVLRRSAFPCRSLVYFGSDTTIGGTPPPGYMESIIAAARIADLPAAHIAMLETFLPVAAPRHGGLQKKSPR